ncbi:MAG: hypothetical protein JSR41_23990 [Proteobacteria bacterium]|nr:hypothetical protein [Pseudomonadota bacterium]
MHSAPSVSYPVGRSRVGHAILWVIWAAGACCACAWRYQNDSNGARWAVVLGAFVVASLALTWALRPQSARVLRWDGAFWSLSGARPMGMAEAAVALDLQCTLLLRLQEAGRATQWLWADRSAAPERWNAMRRAVYCRAPSPQDAGLPNAAAAAPAARIPDFPA